MEKEGITSVDPFKELRSVSGEMYEHMFDGVPKPKFTLNYNVWFTSDLHFGHKNILKHCPERAVVGGFDIEDTKAHDKWLIDVWNKTIGKKDIVYIVGDFAFGNPEDIKKHLLPKLNGTKFLILGNHDKSSRHLDDYFKQITQMKELKFSKVNFPFIEEENFRVFLCHYPMVTWEAKHYGTVQVQGHSHGRLDEFNEESTDLRVDVGIDSTLAGFKPVSLEELYKYFKKKTGGLSFLEYAQIQKENKTTQF